jgi:hypothetical protein
MWVTKQHGVFRFGSRFTSQKLYLSCCLVLEFSMYHCFQTGMPDYGYRRLMIPDAGTWRYNVRSGGIVMEEPSADCNWAHWFTC